jgi:single-stranded-DNA-specific exonuclease
MGPARRWEEPGGESIPGWMEVALGENPILARILSRRGLESPEQLAGFLDPDKYTPSSPTSIPDVSPAVERIEAAISSGERICVWGDFDVDGQTATALLVSSLRRLGGEVSYYIPVREFESHGISLPALQRVIEQGVNLLVTCDTGISEFQAVQAAQRQGVDVIITDHHDLAERLPEAIAVVNPKRLTEAHPAFHLPGVAVAYQVLRALMARAGQEEQLEPLLDLVAIGIVADLARLRDDVRYLLQRGLQVLRSNPRPALLALMEMAEIEVIGVNEEHIGFLLAPRLNAMGRLADANPAVSFLIDNDLGKARKFAGSLEALNERRKLLTGQVLMAAESSLAKNPNYLDAPVLVLEGMGWPAGVIGLVASRLVERYERPVVLLSVDDRGTAQGSARSVERVDISAAIAAQKALLQSYGGHPMAAGLRMDAERIQHFRRSLSEHILTMQPGPPSEKPLFVDAELTLSDVSFDLVDAVERIGPFGPGNSQPIFAARALTVRSQRRIGRDGEHRLLEVVDDAGVSCTAVWWNGGDETPPQGSFDLAFHLRTNTYKGEKALQAVWIEAHAHEQGRITPRAPSRRIELVDLRANDDVHRSVARLYERGAQVWAVGVQVGWQTRSRVQLEPCDELVIWTAPPGLVELQDGLRKADPNVIHFIGADLGLDSLKAFLERLSGMLKYALNERRGRVNIDELAGVLGHKPATVWEGVIWLESRGHILVRAREGDWVEISRGGKVTDAAEDIRCRLEASLLETAAFRRYLNEVDDQSLLRFLEKLLSGPYGP